MLFTNHAKKIESILFFKFILIFKFLLIGEGYLEDTDEEPFVPLLLNFKELIKFNIEAWAYQINVWWSTYLETLIRLPQAALLIKYAEWRNLSTTSPQALQLIGIFNVLINMLIVVFQYKILRRISFTKHESFLGIFLLTTLVNTNLYLTHILPYESSLLFHFISLYIIYNNQLNSRKIFLSGFFSALGFFNYYGNFPFLFIVWGAMMTKLYYDFVKIDVYNIKIRIPFSSVLYTFLISLPCFIFLLILNFISEKGGFSYIQFLTRFSQTIKMGSTEETLFYAFIYFKNVEKAWGFILILVSFSSIFYIFLHRKSINENVKKLFIVALLVYLAYGLQGVLSGEMVFYGRVFRLFYFFIIIGVLIITQIHPRIKYFFWIGAFINMFYVYSDIKSLGFPRSTMEKFGLNGSNNNNTFMYELGYNTDHSYRSFHIDSKFEKEKELYKEPFNQSKITNKKYILKNFEFFCHFPDSFKESYQEINFPNNYKKIFSKKHFMSHPAFTFEYCTKEGRQFFLNQSFKIEIFEKQE